MEGAFKANSTIKDELQSFGAFLNIVIQLASILFISAINGAKAPFESIMRRRVGERHYNGTTLIAATIFYGAIYYIFRIGLNSFMSIDARGVILDKFNQQIVWIILLMFYVRVLTIHIMAFFQAQKGEYTHSQYPGDYLPIFKPLGWLQERLNIVYDLPRDLGEPIFLLLLAWLSAPTIPILSTLLNFASTMGLVLGVLRYFAAKREFYDTHDKELEAQEEQEKRASPQVPGIHGYRGTCSVTSPGGRAWKAHSTEIISQQTPICPPNVSKPDRWE